MLGNLSSHSRGWPFPLIAAWHAFHKRFLGHSANSVVQILDLFIALLEILYRLLGIAGYFLGR